MAISVPHSLAELGREDLAKEDIDRSLTVVHLRFTYHGEHRSTVVGGSNTKEMR